MSENLMDRRDFMKTSVTGLGGFAVLASNEKKEEDKKQTSPKMIYRTLGNTGIRVPVIGMGAAASPEIGQAALNAGVMFIDTSQAYMLGRHEAMDRPNAQRPTTGFICCDDKNLPNEGSSYWFVHPGDQRRRILERRGRQPEEIGIRIRGSFWYSRCLDG